MRVMSFNMNGIRSAERKGFFEWFITQDIDVLCVQETKAQLSDFAEEHFQIPGYYRYHADALKKGYSGVAIYSRRQPNAVRWILNFVQADQEGRYIEADFGDFSVISLYLPSGSSGEHRQVAKFEFMAFFEPLLAKWRAQERSMIICGDWNIVHKEIDIKNFKSNQKNSGCLPEERAWLDNLFSQQGWVDTFRVVNQEAEQYTWWSNRGQARAKNVGWRIDYQIASPDWRKRVISTEIYKAQWFSDHAPLVITYHADC